MTVKQFKPQDLDFYPKIILDYLEGLPFFKDLINGTPSLEGIAGVMDQVEVSDSKRRVLVEALSGQYAAAGLAAPEVLQRLTQNNCYTVTTGHQLCVLSGPLYVIYKIASTLKLAQQLQELHGDKQFVAVFWMATEDHDVAEINHVHLFRNTHIWNTHKQGAVGRFLLDDVQGFVEEVCAVFKEAPFAADLEQRIRKAYHPSHTLAVATRIFIQELFASYPLLIVDGDDALLKQAFAPIMVREIAEGITKNALEVSLEVFKRGGYKPQIQPRSTGLFYLADGGRYRIDVVEQEFEAVGLGVRWLKADLLKQIEQQPTLFSPNVSLRPVYQEFVLPNVAVVGGPGELAYWLQLKSVFKACQVHFPILVLRDSFLFVSGALQKKMEHLGLEVGDLFLESEGLVKRVLGKLESGIDTQHYWKQIAPIFEALKLEVTRLDGSLKGYVEAEQKRLEQQFVGIEKKITQTQKRQHETRVAQALGVKERLFPGGSFQERHDNFMGLYLEQGLDFVDIVVAQCSPLENYVKVIC